METSLCRKKVNEDRRTATVKTNVHADEDFGRFFAAASGASSSADGATADRDAMLEHLTTTAPKSRCSLRCFILCSCLAFSVYLAFAFRAISGRGVAAKAATKAKAKATATKAKAKPGAPDASNPAVQKSALVAMISNWLCEFIWHGSIRC